jgi:hypothetical protein
MDEAGKIAAQHGADMAHENPSRLRDTLWVLCVIPCAGGSEAQLVTSQDDAILEPIILGLHEAQDQQVKMLEKASIRKN